MLTSTLRVLKNREINVHLFLYTPESTRALHTSLITATCLEACSILHGIIHLLKRREKGAQLPCPNAGLGDDCGQFTLQHLKKPLQAPMQTWRLLTPQQSPH